MKYNTLILFFILVLISALAGCTGLGQNLKPAAVSGQSEPEQENLSAAYYFLESRIHIKNNETDKAVSSLQKALEKDPGSFTLTRDLVQLYLQKNQKEKALELVDNLAAKNPDNVEALLFLVQLKKSMMTEQELVEILNRILKLDPENKETFLRLGKIYMDKKDKTAALNLFQKMTEVFPDYYVAWFYLGEVNLELGKFDEAGLHFLKTIELEPELIQPRFELIELYKSENYKGNSKKIIENYTRIIELEPENYQAQLGLALYYHKTGRKKKADELFSKMSAQIGDESRFLMAAVDEYISSRQYDDAVIVFDRLLKENPESSTLNFFAGVSYEAVENYKKAIEHYLKVEPGHPQYKKSVLSAAFLYKKTGSLKKAAQFLEQKMESMSGDIDAAIYLASFYESEADYAKAISVLNKGLETSPDNTSLLFRLGAVQDKAGMREEGIDTMLKIITIDPDDANALNYIGYTYADLGIHLDKALDYIQRAAGLKPEDGYITDSLGWVYYRMGEFAKAVEFLEKAADLSSYETIISDHLGDAYQKTGDLEKAMEAYEKAVANAKEEDRALVEKIKNKIESLKKLIKSRPDA